MKTSSSHPDRRASLATLLGLFLILGAAVIIIPVFSYNFTASRHSSGSIVPSITGAFVIFGILNCGTCSAGNL